VVVGVGGVSLRVSVPTSTVAELGTVGTRVRLHTYLVVREDGLALYGFPSPQALRLFELLQTVGGVGPKNALSLLSTLSPEALAAAIASGDEATLSRAPGVGRKTAARIVLELRTRLEKEWGLVAAPAPAGDDDAVAALMALGYSAQEARSALAALPRGEAATLEERVRLALRHLSAR
jgi:Holliday junction DNA helicase RuvA